MVSTPPARTPVASSRWRGSRGSTLSAAYRCDRYLVRIPGRGEERPHNWSSKPIVVPFLYKRREARRCGLASAARAPRNRPAPPRRPGIVLIVTIGKTAPAFHRFRERGRIV